jgi:hypothetical protein
MQEVSRDVTDSSNPCLSVPLGHSLSLWYQRNQFVTFLRRQS